MASQLENRIRELDLEGEPLNRAAKRIAREHNPNEKPLKEGTIRAYRGSQRLGYKSHTAYLASLRDKKRVKLKNSGLVWPEKNYSLIEIIDPSRFYKMEAPDEYEQRELEVTIQNLLSVLTPRERGIIEQRFYEEKVLEECGKKYSITKERARQIEKMALKKLRTALREYQESA